MFSKIVFLLFSAISVIDYSNGANILAITPIASYSHTLWHRVLLKELHSKGHNITILGVDDETNAQNYSLILMKGVYQKIRETFDLENLPDDPYDTLMQQWLRNQCAHELKTDGFKIIMNYPKNFFDLIIMDTTLGNVCFYPLIAKLGNPPTIGTSPLGLTVRMIPETGDFMYPAIAPYFTLPYTDKMRFWERFHNFLVQFYMVVSNQYLWKQKLIDIVIDAYDERDVAQIGEIEKNITTFLVNSDPITIFPQPMMPNVIPVPGLHIKPLNKLPEDIKEFLDNAENGAILFSLGTNVQSRLLSEHKRNILLAAFSKLPYRILWKWESDTLPGKPKNVMIKKWIPQSDVLNHPRVKLFFSHSGLLSTQEAIYFHVPILGMPFFYDQIYNINRSVKKGIALKVDFKTITEEKIIEAITEIITNPKYQREMNILSEQLRDQPETPLTTAVYWIERTIRYRGGHFFQSATVHLSAFEAYCLDVVAVILLIITLITFTLFKIIKNFVMFIYATKSSKSRKQTKSKRKRD